MKPSQTRRKILGVITALAISSLGCYEAQAASAADKLEQLGEMRSLEVTAIRMVRRNDFLHVQAEVLSIDRQAHQMYYRFKWLDSSGFRVGDEEGWKPVVVYGNQKKLIESIAPVQAATDFRIELHSADNNGKPGQRPD